MYCGRSMFSHWDWIRCEKTYMAMSPVALPKAGFPRNRGLIRLAMKPIPAITRLQGQERLHRAIIGTQSIRPYPICRSAENSC
jgi:hypothetical protein